MSPANPVIAKVENASRSKRRVVLSEDESDTVSTKRSVRKSRPSFKTVESTDNSEAERDARALMDIDDGISFLRRRVDVNMTE
jgi:DNA polymerase delta subunit 3